MELDCSVIPVFANKKPMVKWEEFQKRKASEDEIKAWWGKNPKANVGIVTGAISNLCVVDIDEPKGFEAIKDYIPNSIKTPRAKTPRGGEHLYFKTPDKSLANNSRLIPGCDFRGNGGFIVAPPSIGTNGKQYEWVLGLSLFNLPMQVLPLSYISLINSLAFNINARARSNDHAMFTKGTRDDDLFHVANHLVKSRMPDGEVTEILKRLALSCDPTFPLDEIPAKIDSAIKRAERREFNLTEEIRAWISVTDGDFSVTDWLKSGQTASSVTNRDTARKVFQRFKQEGYIEKAGKKDGVYCRKDNQLEELDFINAEEKVLDLQWPFEVEKWVKIMPRNLIVIAGEVNAGKTAYLLNFSALNMLTHEIHYFSSEMGAIELRARLGKFETSLKSWKVKFWERSSAFDAVIQPNAINVIDFLEIHDEFYKVGLLMKQIYDKLEDGVAIIALQKNPKTDFGLGGMRSIEKARLYLSLENGVIKIVKGKNWASETNPNGISRTFKLVQGAKFLSTSEWRREK